MRLSCLKYLFTKSRRVMAWTLTTLREYLIKIGAKVVARPEAVTSQVAEVAVPRRLFASSLEWINRLRLVTGTEIDRPEGPNPGEGKGRVPSRRGDSPTQGVASPGIPLIGVFGSISMHPGINRGGSPSSRTVLTWGNPNFIWCLYPLRRRPEGGPKTLTLTTV